MQTKPGTFRAFLFAFYALLFNRDVCNLLTDYCIPSQRFGVAVVELIHSLHDNGRKRIIYESLTARA